MLAESLLNAPVLLPIDLRRVENALLPTALLQFRNFGIMLEPRYIVGAGPLDQ